MSLEFYNAKTQIAHKTHICSLCRNEIPKGEKYIYIASKYDGDFETSYYHTACNQVIDQYADETGETEYTEDDIMYWWRDEMCQNCKYFYVETCDSSCDWFGERQECDERSKGGKCSQGETCDIMDRVCWCSKYEKDEKG